MSHSGYLDGGTHARWYSGSVAGVRAAQLQKRFHSLRCVASQVSRRLRREQARRSKPFTAEHTFAIVLRLTREATASGASTAAGS